MPEQTGQPATDIRAAVPYPQDRYQYAIQAAGVGVWDFDIRSGNIWWSDNLPAIHGISPGDFDGTLPGYLPFVHPDDRAGLQMAIDAALAACGEFQHEFRVIDPAGNVRWIEAKGRVVCGNDGNPDRMMGVGIDVSVRHAERAAQKELAEKLDAERLRLQSILEQIPSGVAIAEGGTGRLLLGNRRMQEILRYEFREAASMADYDQFHGLHPDGTPMQPHEWPLARAITSGVVTQNELIEILLGDGSRGIIDVSAAPIIDPMGRIVAAVVIFSDVTDRERATAEQRFLAGASAVLASSLEVADTLQQVAKLGIPILGDWCLIHLLNDPGELSCVASASIELPAHLRDYDFDPCYPPNKDATLGPYRVLQTGEPELTGALDQQTLGALLKDPDDLPHVQALNLRSMLVVPLRARGRVIGTISFFTSTSNRTFTRPDIQLAEDLAGRAALSIDNARLYASVLGAEELYRTVFENVEDAIFVIDTKGRMLEVNDAASRIVGYSRDELLSRNLLQLGANQTDFGLADLRRLRRNGSWRGEYLLRRKNGAHVPVESNVTVVSTRSGLVYLGVARDITERRNLEQLRQDFLAMVTHDLRSPLAALRLNAQLLQRRGVFDPSTVEAIIGQVDRVTRISTDLADVVRMEGGKLEIHRTKADIMSIARAAVAGIQSSRGNHPIEFEEPDGPVVAAVDPDRVAQIVQNLVDNAIKHSGTDAPVLVRISANEDRAKLEVIDEGSGIPSEHRQHLFKRFHRSAPSEAGGLGLGLYIVRMLAEAHGGTIEFSSEAGKGANFTVSLPREFPET